MFSTLFVLLITPCLSHMRLQSPEPRNTGSNIKSGPCGDETDDFTGTITDIEPGTFTIEIEETIHHSQAPYRIALSNVEDDTYDCILLDHIPQHTMGDTATLYIDVIIPNVECSPCAIQVISFMTDKIDDGSCCEYDPDGRSGSCFSNYHSCANINIITDPNANDYISNRNNLICEQPDDWPFKDWATAVYTQEESTNLWESIGGDDTQLSLIIDGNSQTNPCAYLTEGETEGNNTRLGRSNKNDENGDGAVSAVLAVVLVLGIIGLILGGAIGYTKFMNKNQQQQKSTFNESNNEIAAQTNANQTNIVATSD